MKTILLVVGRTVEQHYITAINDYIERTKRYISFDMEVIPELKNTKSLTEEQQKEKEGELICKFFSREMLWCFSMRTAKSFARLNLLHGWRKRWLT